MLTVTELDPFIREVSKIWKNEERERVALALVEVLKKNMEGNDV